MGKHWRLAMRNRWSMFMTSAKAPQFRDFPTVNPCPTAFSIWISLLTATTSRYYGRSKISLACIYIEAGKICSSFFLGFHDWIWNCDLQAARMQRSHWNGKNEPTFAGFLDTVFHHIYTSVTNWLRYYKRLVFSVCGPEVYGIWPENSAAGEVNCADLSHISRTLATGDDSGFVKLFEFPCRKPMVSLCDAFECFL